MEAINKTVRRQELIFIAAGDMYKIEPGGVVDGVYIDLDGRICGSVRDGELRLAAWVLI